LFLKAKRIAIDRAAAEVERLLAALHRPLQ
jgi:hypothetical protein